MRPVEINLHACVYILSIGQRAARISLISFYLLAMCTRHQSGIWVYNTSMSVRVSRENNTARYQRACDGCCLMDDQQFAGTWIETMQYRLHVRKTVRSLCLLRRFLDSGVIIIIPFHAFNILYVNCKNFEERHVDDGEARVRRLGECSVILNLGWKMTVHIGGHAVSRLSSSVVHQFITNNLHLLFQLT
jgi:hypothetical protein